MNTRFKKLNRDNFTVLTLNLCVSSKTQDDDDIIKYDLLLSHMERLLWFQNSTNIFANRLYIFYDIVRMFDI